MKKAFIFDLDGVITDTAKYHYVAWKALGEKLGITIDEVFNEELKGISRLDSLELILNHGGQGANFTLAEKEALAVTKNQAYVELLVDLSPADLLPGVADFLATAQAAQIPCGIASASKNAPMILEKLGVADYFQIIVDPASLSQGKPDPEIFLKAADALNVSPAEAVGFEDAQAGVDALKAAGIYAVGIETEQPLQGTDISVGDLSQLNFQELINQ